MFDCGIVYNYIVGPYFIDETLNGVKYNEFLSETLPTLLNENEMPFSARLALWFQHDCPTHNSLIVRTKLLLTVTALT